MVPPSRWRFPPKELVAAQPSGTSVSPAFLLFLTTLFFPTFLLAPLLFYLAGPAYGRFFLFVKFVIHSLLRSTPHQPFLWRVCSSLRRCSSRRCCSSLCLSISRFSFGSSSF